MPEVSAYHYFTCLFLNLLLEVKHHNFEKILDLILDNYRGLNSLMNIEEYITLKSIIYYYAPPNGPINQWLRREATRNTFRYPSLIYFHCRS